MSRIALSLDRRFTPAAVVAVVAALAPVPLAAQTTPSDRIETIEQQIRQLQSELQRLKGELGETKQQLRASQAETKRAREQAQQAKTTATQAKEQVQATVAAPVPPAALAPPVVAPAAAAAAPAPPGPRAVQTSENRFGIASADGRNSIFLTGRLHLDTGDYLDYTPQSKKFASVQDLNSGVNARRARIGITGKFEGDWDYTLIYDFGGASDGLPPALGAPTSGIENAYVTYNGLNKGKVPLAFDIGYLDTPFTLTEPSSNDTVFAERASIQVIGAGIFADDFRSALGARSNDDRYWAGVYLTGPRTGDAHGVGEQYGAFGRATYQIMQDADYTLHVGVDAGGLLKPPTVGGVRTITLSDRPEDRVDPTVILSTGALGTAAHPVNDAAVYVFEGAAGYRNLFVQGEYYHIMVDRNGLATNGFDGGYIEATWIPTGEHRRYLPSGGRYMNPIPDHPFSPWDSEYGLGAIELAARFSTITLNDNFTPGVAPAANSNAVGGGKQTVYAAGVNWYPNANMRFMFDYLHGSIDKRFSTAAGGGIAGTPLGTPVGGNFDAVIMRTQYQF